MLAFELCADNKTNGPAPRSPRGRYIHGFQKDFEILTHQTTEQFPILPRHIFNELGPREDSRVSTSCLYVCLSLHAGALTFCICGCSD